MKTIDLHAHTTASDGSYTPSELVRYAKEKGLSALAITDHDTLSGIDEAMREGELIGMRVIPGSEISTRLDDCDVHLIALFVDPKNENLNKRLDEMEECRRERNYEMARKLHAAGFPIDEKDLDEMGGRERILARGHIAQLLADRGCGSSMKDVLTKYLCKGQAGYVPKEVISPGECIRLVHDAGGLIFVAHLHQIDPSSLMHSADIARRIIAMGADGLETEYCEFDDERREVAEKIAAEYACLRSGGSDFHGRLKKGLDLAVGYGDLAVPYAFLEAMEERRAGQKS